MAVGRGLGKARDLSDWRPKTWEVVLESRTRTASPSSSTTACPRSGRTIREGHLPSPPVATGQAGAVDHGGAINPTVRLSALG